MVPIVTTLSQAICPHGGQIILATTADALCQIQGGFALLVTDIHAIAGCPFTLPSAVYHPCVLVRWSAGAVQTKVNGIPVLLQTSVGICYAADQAPQGPAIITQTQQIATGL
jgi:hypothetical protein